MPAKTDSWIAPDATELGYREWLVDGVPRATVIAMHGLSCRDEDFDPLGEVLATRGIRLAAWNLRGQGLDPVTSRRGAWLEVEGMREDLAAFAEYLCSDEEPVFVCGDSMGALLALQAAVWEPWCSRLAGLLLIVPVVELAQKNPPWVKPVLVATSGLAPNLRLKPSWFVHGKGVAPKLTRIPERQEAVITAPHRTGPTTIKFLSRMGDLIEASTPAAKRLKTPLAVFSAGHDVFVKPEGIERFFAEVATPEKTLFHYPESYHQILFDLDAPQVVADAVGWIEARLATSKSTR